MNAPVDSQISGNPMLRAPSQQEVSHLFALAEHEIIHGRLTEALLLLRFIRSIDPSHTDAAARTALVLFRREQWADAWDAFDIRFKLMPSQPSVTLRNADGSRRDVPRWSGGPPPKKLLVMDEQGLGDTIHFSRFLRFLVEKGVDVTFVTHRILFDLLKTLDLPITLKPSDEPGSVEGVGGWTPLLHIPRALNIDPARYSETVPYIKADPVRVEKWKAKLPKDKFLIGIAWAGNPDSPAEKGRSVPLETFAPLAELPNVALVVLQKGKGLQEAETVSFADRLIRLGDDFDEGGQAFLDSAAVMMSLDRVVSVDTSILHVAGALGRPTDLLLRREPDWRWLARESDNVWYPSVTLFRQKTAGDWREPMETIRDNLLRVMGKGSDGEAPASVKSELPSEPTRPLVPVSVGELADRRGILDLKTERASQKSVKAEAKRQRAALDPAWEVVLAQNDALVGLDAELRAINAELWEVEDRLRLAEAQKVFDESFVALARSVYRLNDRRSEIKRRIDRMAGSTFTEIKSYAGKRK